MNSALIFPPGDVNNVDALTCKNGRNADVRDVLRLFPEGKSPTEINAYTLTSLTWPVRLLGAAPQPQEERVRPIFAMQGRPLDTFSAWVQGVSQGPLSQLGELPPAIELHLRIGWNAVTAQVAIVTILPPNWNETALAFQFSGIHATRFELWGGTFSGGVNRPAREINITWAAMVSYKGCCESTIIPGSWDFEPPP